MIELTNVITIRSFHCESFEFFRDDWRWGWSRLCEHERIFKSPKRISFNQTIKLIVVITVSSFHHESFDFFRDDRRWGWSRLRERERILKCRKKLFSRNLFKNSAVAKSGPNFSCNVKVIEKEFIKKIF
jgi:hypothetical protein